MRYYLFLLVSIIAIGVGAQPAHDLKRAKRLWQKPAQEYRMKTWWFFGYEQTTDEGITADAEALRKLTLWRNAAGTTRTMRPDDNGRYTLVLQPTEAVFISFPGQ